MLNAIAVFSRSIAEARHHTTLYDFLTSQPRVPAPFDDLLRAQIVISVAAFDKLMHDIVRIGICGAFSGVRPVTSKYLSESISIELHSALVSATIPPKEVLFEQAIVQKLRHLSFQHPDKISEALSLIWNEKHKWDKIALPMGLTGPFASTKMKLIAGRRNAIVHESDMDPLTNSKTPITRAECNDITDFIEACGISIVNAVR
ncbi:MAG: hypothetical protein B7Y97_06665 [Sphingomonas sp. 32-66-10]|nr:MAG: hypothetical protein B7Y97_06665 [Sphingomonas sp. 32-66-10]